MRKFTTIFLTFLILIIGVNSDSYAQSKNLQKLIDNPKIYSKGFVYTGVNVPIRKWQIKKGFATEKDYVLPKKVGILTFMIQDQSKSYTASNDYQKTTTTLKATKDGASSVANQIYDNTIVQLKENFSNKGMELLEVNEYLNTEEKRTLYNNYELKELKYLKAFSGITGQGNSGPAIGYRVMATRYFGSSRKAVKARNDFFNQLDLDALLIVEIGLSVVGNKLMSVNSGILYKNPASGTKTIYNDYNEGVSVKHAVSPYEKKPTYSKIFLSKEVEYKNKRGKIKTKKKFVDLDPNLYKLVCIAVDANIRGLQKYVTGKK